MAQYMIGKIKIGIFTFLWFFQNYALGIQNATYIIKVPSNHPFFSIQLPSNRTTGYEWHLTTYNPKYVQVLKTEYQIKNSHLIGAGGKENWFFKLTPLAFSQPDNLSITFSYSRSWNKKEIGQIKIFQIAIQK